MTEALYKLIAEVEEGIWPGADMHDCLGSDRRGELAYDAFNGSLDSAVALKDALLPGWGWDVGDYVVVAGASVFSDYPARVERTNAPSAARALLLATLRAVQEDRRRSLNRPA